MEVAKRYLLSKTHQFTAVRIAIEVGIFGIMANMTDSVIELDRLAADAHADPLLIG